MKLLITGSQGLVGTSIVPMLQRDFEITAIDIEEWDILDRKTGIAVLSQYKPHVVLNLAAMTNVDGCEDRPAEAERLNGEGPGILAELCGERGIRLVHFSTDYVFDGDKKTPYTEDDAPNPKSVYGATKLSGEKRIFASLPSALVVRAQWIYGAGGESFISKVIRFAEQNGSARVVDDQRGAPTYAKDLALPLRRLIEGEKSGIYHVANSGWCTWYEFAKEIFRCKGMDVPVTPISSATLNSKAARPACSVFDCSKLRNHTGVIMRTWQEALKDYLAGNE
ncbi:MAG TPA: dTDP-4-dehydrorhamnose reductase [Syntrophorhabdaceae bacterium]|jgi:dTDP-4-dehydrorhamnose reductase